MSIDILLIHPPIVKPAEPPLGVAILAAHLRRLGLKVEVLDLNMEAFRILLTPEGLPSSSDVFSKRAVANVSKNTETIRSPAVLRSPGRYKTAVKQLERVLHLRSQAGNLRISFTDLKHAHLSPIRSEDLAAAAEFGTGEDILHPVMKSRVADFVSDLRPRWVGLSVNYLNQVLPAMSLAGILRDMDPRVQSVMGGSMITTWGARLTRKKILRPWVDAWVCGPGEVPLNKLLGRSGTPRSGGPPELDYDWVSWSDYLSPEPILPMTIGLGCYWGNCRFCPECIAGSRYEAPRLQDLPGTMEDLAARYRVRWFHFTDNALAPPILYMLSRMKTSALWYGFARFEDLLQDIEMVRGLRLSGCRMLQLGLESGSQRILDAMRKGVDLSKASRILKTLHREGIGTYVYVMFGFPGETEDDARRTLDFIARHSPWIDYLSCSIMNLPRGAKGIEKMKRFDFPGLKGDLSLYTDFRPRVGMDRKGARLFIEREFHRHPHISPILGRVPPVFTSNHAPLFHNANAYDTTQPFHS